MDDLRSLPQPLLVCLCLLVARGSEEVPQRANRIWKDLLANYEQPPLDEAIREELEEFVARRKAEGGAPTN